MGGDFFKELIGLAPGHWYTGRPVTEHWEPFADSARVNKADEGIEAAIDGFCEYLTGKQPQDRGLIVEYVTRELVDAYYTVRRAMKRFSDPDPEKDKGRESLLSIYNATVLLIESVIYYMKIQYSDEFISSLKKRNETIFTEVIEDYQGQPQNHDEPVNLKKQMPEPKAIDEEALGKYFKPQFKGMGNINTNYLNAFVDELKTPRTKKELAQIAALCYEGKQMNDRKPQTFAAWRDAFGGIVGYNLKTYNNRKKLLDTMDESLKNLFAYLT